MSMFGESTWILVFVIVGLLGAVAVWRHIDGGLSATVTVGE
jgi:hypothetical protein